MLIWKYLIIRWKKQKKKKEEEVKGLTLTCNGICLFSDGNKLILTQTLQLLVFQAKIKYFFNSASYFEKIPIPRLIPKWATDSQRNRSVKSS